MTKNRIWKIFCAVFLIVCFVVNTNVFAEGVSILEGENAIDEVTTPESEDVVMNDDAAMEYIVIEIPNEPLLNEGEEPDEPEDPDEPEPYTSPELAFYYGTETTVGLPSGHGNMNVTIHNLSSYYDMIIVMYDYSYSSNPIWNQYADEGTMLLRGGSRTYYVGSNIDRVAVIGANGLGTFRYSY